jgi:(E)-4-hydroxy-3-methylbut-2-enyl-diphosphate synthase
MTDLGVDFIYAGQTPILFMLPNGVKAIYDFGTWQKITDKLNSYPLYTADALQNGITVYSQTLNFIQLKTNQLTAANLSRIQALPHAVCILQNEQVMGVPDLRNACIQLQLAGIHQPIIFHNSVVASDAEDAMLKHATLVGTLCIEGFGDGVMLSDNTLSYREQNEVAFGILQAARARITKTEYISCPSCGRTLFDLQDTTALIRKHTDHLKGVKIAIMGCIVNGPGEMADADYGYVGSGPGKITLYKGKEVVKKGVNKETAVNELIELIKQDGNWIER